MPVPAIHVNRKIRPPAKCTDKRILRIAAKDLIILRIRHKQRAFQIRQLISHIKGPVLRADHESLQVLLRNIFGRLQNQLF